jgi:hypothetical protein
VMLEFGRTVWRAAGEIWASSKALKMPSGLLVVEGHQLSGTRKSVRYARCQVYGDVSTSRCDFQSS